MNKRSAVLIPRPPSKPDGEAPRWEYTVIAETLDADLITYDSGCESSILRYLFSRNGKIGSAANFVRQAKQYDRCYVSGEGIGIPLAVALKTIRWKGKMACVFHDMENPHKKRLASVKKSMLSWAGHEMFSRLITVSELQADNLKTKCGIPPEKVTSVLNWVDDRFFAPEDAHKDNVFMACGAENRDYATLIAAASQVPTKQFAVYGHGYFTHERKSEPSSANVTWMSRVSYADLRQAYAKCTAVILPLNDVEYAAGATGLVEAMAAGKPVIVTASRGLMNYLESFDMQLVIPPYDAGAMANAIRWLDGDVLAQQRIGAHNRKIAEQFCSVDNYAELIKSILS